MAKLIYSAIASLDGYVEDADGKFDWAAPDEEVHAYVNDLERPIGTYLYGRRMYETMRFWETVNTQPGSTAVRDFAEIWRAAEKIVYSTTLERPTTDRTRLERSFDAETIANVKAGAGSDITIGGATLAAVAFRSGLIDECHLFLMPVVVGAGKHALPPGLHAKLELLNARRFAGGAVHLGYRVGASR